MNLTQAYIDATGDCCAVQAGAEFEAQTALASGKLAELKAARAEKKG